MLQITPPIEVRPRGLPHSTISSFEEAISWAQKELTAWDAWRHTQVNQPLVSWRDEVVEPVRQMHDWAQTALRQQDNPAAQTALANNIRTVFNQYQSGPLIASESPDGRRLLDRVRSGDAVGAVFEAGTTVNGRPLTVSLTAQGQRFDFDFRTVFQQSVRELIVEEVVKARDSAEIATQQTIMELFEARLNSALEDFAAAAERLKSQRDQELAKHSRFRHSLASALRQARADFKAIRRTYETEMALKAPATYWRDRAATSRKVATMAFVGFICSGGIAALFVHNNVELLRTWITGSDGKADLAALLALSPIVVIMLWFFRMITRLYTVAMSESVDASQRAVMLRTFLAIMHDPGTHVSEAERYLILQALFRSQGGKDESEGMPANVVEAVVKAAQGKV